MEKKRDHLPLFGVGPAIVFGQFAIALAAIALSWLFGPWLKVAGAARIALGVVGVCLIAFGLYLDISAKYKSKLFENVAQNKLVTTGVYAITRNPVYSAALLVSTGALLIWGDLACLVAAIVCWAYMTVFVKRTEEVWLKDLYGQEFDDYCARTNRCIPWLPKGN